MTVQPSIGEITPEDVGWAELRMTPAGAGLARLLDDRNPASLEDASLVDALTAARRQASYYEAQQLTLMQELYRRRQVEDQERREVVKARSQTLTELQPVLGQSRTRLGSRLRLGEALATRLPRVWGLLSAGRIDEYTASLIVSELDKLTDESLVPVVEQKVVDRLAAGIDGEGVVVTPPAQVGRWARALVAEAEPDRHEERFRKGFADRSVGVFGTGDGLADLVLSHSSAELEALSHRLSLIARQTGADDPRSMDQRRADVAVDLLLGRAECTVSTSRLETGDLDPGDGPDRAPVNHGGGVGAQVHVTVPIQTLMGVSDHPGQLLNGEPVPASLVRRIATDPSSTWYRLLTDPVGNLLDLSTKSYKPTPPLYRAIVARDRTCVAPGCTTSAQAGETDHTIRYSEGGSTSYDNTGRPCQSHHRAKESPGFQLTQPTPGVFVWSYPSGHAYTSRPDPHPVADWPDHWQQPVSATQLQDALRMHDLNRRLRDDARLRDTTRRVLEARLRGWYAASPDDRDERVDPDEPILDHETTAVLHDLLEHAALN
ncbi:MAG: DUF222 domain-containing protein [Propionibacteriales bacterium]|nr:DUF222 domain-containing protein [Propionibacteriales bacterium]